MRNSTWRNPLGFEKDSSLPCRLMKSLYGLKQTLRYWYENIDYSFINIGFKHCEPDNNIYVLHINSENIIVVVYVDDLVIVGSNINMIFGLKK